MAYGKRTTKRSKTPSKVSKTASKAGRSRKIAAARRRKSVPAATKDYVERKLDRRIPDKTFRMRRDYFTNSGLTNGDLYPLLGLDANVSGHNGINIPQCITALGEELNSVQDYKLDQHFRKGIRLKHLSVKGVLSLPIDWFLKGTGYSYLIAHIWIFCLKKTTGRQDRVSSSDLFVNDNEVNNGRLDRTVDNALGGASTGFTGSWSDQHLRWNSQRYKLLASRKVLLSGGTSNITQDDFFGTTLPAGFGTGSHGASNPRGMRKEFNIRVPCPKFLKWDMNEHHDSSVDDNRAAEFMPYMAIGYSREGGADTVDTMLHARYTTTVRVEPPLSSI